MKSLLICYCKCFFAIVFIALLVTLGTYIIEGIIVASRYIHHLNLIMFPNQTISILGFNIFVPLLLSIFLLSLVSTLTCFILNNKEKINKNYKFFYYLLIFSIIVVFLTISVGFGGLDRSEDIRCLIVSLPQLLFNIIIYAIVLSLLIYNPFQVLLYLENNNLLKE